MEGVFNKYHVNAGDKVKKGQLLASQSIDEYEIELVEAGFVDGKGSHC